MDGHDAFAKAAQPKREGTGAVVGGSALLAHGVASAPVLRVGRKTPHKMVAASPKKQAGRYQHELVGAMKSGKVDSASTLRAFKTPSGRYINAGGTHREVARQAMGTPTKKVEVKPLGIEPRESLYERGQRRLQIGELHRASRKAAAGKPMKPVGSGARHANLHLAAAADTNDDALWHAVGPRGVDSGMKNAIKMAHGVKAYNAGLAGVVGAGVLAAGLHERHQSKKKVVKAMNSTHDAFELSKAAVVKEDPKKAGKKVQVVYPPEVKAYIENKAADLAKSATGHDAFELEEISKFGIGGAMSAVKGLRPGGLLKDAKMGFKGDLGTKATGGHTMAFHAGARVQRDMAKVGALKPKVGNLVRKNPMKAAGVAGGTGLVGGYAAGRH
jgi:hypothetical protein